MVGSIGYFFFAFTDVFHYIINHGRHEFNHSVNKLIVFANLDKILHSQKNIFSWPHIPTGVSSFDIVCGNNAVCGIHRQHIVNRGFEGVVQILIFCAAVQKATAAHHFAPILASPAKISVIGPKSVLIDKSFPNHIVLQIKVFYKVNVFLNKTRVFAFIFRKNKGIGRKIRIVNLS